MSEGKVRFAVVGCGHIGKRHAAMIASNDEAELAALCDIRPREALGLEHDNTPFYSSIEELLSSGIEYDVVNICTPNGLHSEQAILALKAGKHVVCEKPMGITTKGCRKMIEVAEKTGLHVFVVMQNRYSPPAQWIKEVVDKGLLGNIYMVHMNCFWNRDKNYYLRGGDKEVGSDITLWRGTTSLDGGTLFTQFSHFLDMMFWLFGDIDNIDSRFDDFNHRGV
ncbi:MAG: Gfo/Idh/MocA family protein, partial [Flavobacteriales bacterium]